MEGTTFVASVSINGESFANTLIDTGCPPYGLIGSEYVNAHNLERIIIEPQDVTGFDGDSRTMITEAAFISIDLDGHYEKDIFLYIVPQIASYDMILGMGWIEKNDVRLNTAKSECLIKSTSTVIRNRQLQPDRTMDYQPISAVAFHKFAKRKPSRTNKVEIFAASMADISKALRTKTKADPAEKLPKQYHEFLDVFSRTNAEKLPPLRGAGIDHSIELEKVEGVTPKVPWGPLYNMSRDELLVLRKTLTEYLDKGFIRVSNSPAAAPVLFVRKPGGGLRFCVDYRGLNKITRKDRYPLPLIYETLRNIGKAKWFTKVDVIAAFHKIRVAEGDEWKTAFRTRYGLYEWLVTPFGLANAPSTFQRYINWALRDYLDDFCSAYVDDVLIYSEGTIEEHREHVKKVFVRLRKAGLQLDIDKSEFEVKETKYLGFVIDAERGVRMDPEKVKAILEWEAPKTATGVRSFLGFANFYRTFIKNYSDLAMPLTALTHKDTQFIWTDECEKAFEKMKKIFTTAPILVQFDPDRETVLETDSSGWCIGGTLMQYNDDGLLHPCGYFSKKNSPAECNYEIYDKEMLAIVRCLEQWDAELRSVKEFLVRTDHKNLLYFMEVQKLTERQMRWSLHLSKYNFVLEYVRGPENERADALSRREQDMPQGASDERIDSRSIQLLKPSALAKLPKDTIRVMAVRTTQAKEPREAYSTRSKNRQLAEIEIGTPRKETAPTIQEDKMTRVDRTTLTKKSREAYYTRSKDRQVAETEIGTLRKEAATTIQEEEKTEADRTTQSSESEIGPDKEPEVEPLPKSGQERSDLERSWDLAVKADKSYDQGRQAVLDDRRTFPTSLGLKVSIAECKVNSHNQLTFRGRLWVPENELLRTKIIQQMHDSKACGHPGRDSTAQIISRQYFWPRMSADVRRFVRNCDACGRNKAWRDQRMGFLKPLPVPDQIWKEISIDFIVELPKSNGCTNLVVITDRLSKAIICDGLEDITAPTLAKWFVRNYYRWHYLPRAIVSDRGSQFVGKFWKKFCDTLGIVRRLSTAYHPETDGATERMNQTLETYLRTFVDYAQDDWYHQLPSAQIAINNRDAAATKVSPFFMSHGYNIEPLELHREIDHGDRIVRQSPIAQAEQVIRKLKDAREWAQSAMAAAQQQMEDTTNRKRQQAPSFKVGDKVWLNLENVRTDRPTKKLDAKHAKYTIIEAVGSHAYRLDTPPGVHPVFHSKLLRLASYDPLPGQEQDDSQPQPKIIGADEEWDIDRIEKEKTVRGKKKLLVRWIGWAKPTWEPAEEFKESFALAQWEARQRKEKTD